jgi:GLPGLI family protein
MKKPVILFLLFTLSIYSQLKTSKISYGLVIGNDKVMDNGPMADYYKEAKKNAKYVSFSLDFNDNEMLFYENMKMNGDNNNTSFSTAFSGVNGKYFKEKNSNIILNEVENKLLGNFLVKSSDNTKWVLSKESKKIQNYLCYKATTDVTVTNEVGTFKRTVIAWYCPKLPFSFGPKAFCGLPGLIMELQDRNIVIGVTKIELKTKSAVITKPNKGKIVTYEEYNKLIEDFSKKMKEENDGK